MSASNQEITQMNLYEKLERIRKLVEVLRKDKKGFNYKYTTEESVLAKVTFGMAKYHVSLVPSITPNTATSQLINYENVKVTKDGKTIKSPVNEYLVQAEMTYTWVNNDNMEDSIVVPWLLVGSQSDPSQAFGSGLTYSNRYFILKFFHVATTEDDPDNWRQKQAEAKAIEGAEVCKGIIEQIDKKVKSMLKDDKDGKIKAKITETLKDNIVINGKKSANYINLTEPEMAAKALEALNNMEVK